MLVCDGLRIRLPPAPACTTVTAALVSENLQNHLTFFCMTPSFTFAPEPETQLGVPMLKAAPALPSVAIPQPHLLSGREHNRVHHCARSPIAMAGDRGDPAERPRK
jgi:hypothetical protein